MANHILTTKKPWVLLVFALVAVNTIVALTTAFGVAGNPLDALATQPTMFIPASATTAGAESTALGLAGILLLALDVIVLYGLSQGHVWSWYLLFFVTAAALVTALLGAVSGAPLNFIPLVINVVMLAALLHKQVIRAFNVDLKVLPAEGVWGTD